MSIKIGRAAMRTLVPKQEIEVTVTIFAEQNVYDIQIEEILKNGFSLLEKPQDRKIDFTSENYPQLAFLAKGHSVSISYWVKVNTTPEDLFNSETKGVAKIQIAGKAKACSSSGKEVKTRIKTSNFFVVAPMVIVETMEMLDNGDLILIVRNNGNIDAKSVRFSISIALDLSKKAIKKLIINILNIDHLSNKYEVRAEVSNEAVYEFVTKDFVKNLIQLVEKRKEKRVSNIFKQKSPISIAADGRERLVCVAPVTG